MHAASYQFDDVKYGQVHPIEDAWAVSGQAIVVADGITRDPLELSDFTGHSVEEAMASYPDPSPAKLAADMFCRVFIHEIEKSPNANLKDVALAANAALIPLGDFAPIDYLVHDYPACVATGAVFNGYKLTWMTCGDTQLSVFNAAGEIKLSTPDGVANWADYSTSLSFDWNKPEGRRFVREEYRNRTDKIIDGKVVSYGAFTGETEVEPFILTGELELEAGDLVVCYSDGFAAQIIEPDFLVRVTDGGTEFEEWSQKLAKLDYSKFGHERTLVAVWID